MGTRKVPDDVLNDLTVSLLDMAKLIVPWLLSMGYKKLIDVKEDYWIVGRNKLWFGPEATII